MAWFTNDLMNLLAKELPEGYSIEVSVERGAGCVHLWLPDMDDEYECIHVDSVETSMLLALKRAKELASNPTGEVVN